MHYIIISGPSGAGKSSIINSILTKVNDCHFSISTTTRDKRDKEVDGADYHFIKEDEFKEGIKNNKFLEYAYVHGNYYGTSIDNIKKYLEEKKLILLDIDVQGYKQIKNKIKNLVSIFITTNNLKTLEERLKNRGTDSKDSIKKRLDMAREEIKNIYNYDYIIINENLEESIKKALNIIQTIKYKKSKEEINKFINNW